MKKKIIKVILLVLEIFLLVGCKKTPVNTEDLYKNDEVKVKETLDSITLENNFISLSFNLDNGSLIGLKNNMNKREFLIGNTGGNFSMMIDVSTSNPFETDYQGLTSTRVTSRNQTMEYELNHTSESAILKLNYDVKFNFNNTLYDGIKVIEMIEIKKGLEEVTFDYEIINNCQKEITICNFTGAQLSGLKDDSTKKLKLFWPNKEGKIYDDAIDKIMNVSGNSQNLVNVYPGLCSMQLAQLFNEEESLYYFVKDSTREYKTINYGSFIDSKGYDYNEVPLDERVSLSFTQFPFIPSSTTKKVFTTVVGVSQNSSWYKGSDAYQKFLSENDMLNDYSKFPDNWNGFLPLIASQYGSKHFATYKPSEIAEISYADWIENNGIESGIDTVVVNGWNEGGFDSMYPDYEFIEGDSFQGEEGFREMTNSIKQNGDLIICHMNSRIVDEESKWSKEENDGLSNLYKSGIKRAGFRSDMSKEEYEDYLICETYSTGTMYYVMSPASKEFQDQVKSVAKRLRDNGANGIWYDQLYERDSNLDYDESHKMSEKSTPATLYSEGYIEILSYFKQLKDVNDDPWLILCGGGGGDYFAKYTDVYAGNWSRKLASSDNTTDNTIDKSGTENCDRHIMSPELIKYTVKGIYIGQAGAGTLSGQDFEYARAFLFASPFLVEQFTKTTKQLINVYESKPDIFYHGIYKDKNGIKLNKDEVLASIILNKDANEFAIQVFNETEEKIAKLEIVIDPNKLNIEGQIESCIDLFTGEEYKVNNNKITISLESYAFTSLYVTYK